MLVMIHETHERGMRSSDFWPLIIKSCGAVAALDFGPWALPHPLHRYKLRFYCTLRRFYPLQRRYASANSDATIPPFRRRFTEKARITAQMGGHENLFLKLLQDF